MQTTAVISNTIDRSFNITQQACVSDFVLNNAPNVEFQFSNDDHCINTDINDEPRLIQKDVEKRNVNSFLTGIALATDVKSECWKQRAEINQFFHNVLAQFIYIYLNPNKPVLDQIQEMIDDIENHKINQVIKRLQISKQALARQLVIYLRYIVMNAGNPNNLGGAVTYKRGTVEEALCRKSDLFLNMLFFHASRAYQKDILMELMKVFIKMLKTSQPPISTKEESDLHAERWVNLIYKTTHEGYHIKPGEIHCHDVIFFIDNKNLPSLDALKQFSNEDRQKFFNACKYATVFDIVSEDLRLETKTLKFLGFQEKDQDVAGFDVDMRAITTALNEVTKNQKSMLVMVPLGCGAFGNKIEDFWAALVKWLPKMTEHTALTLVIREDNCFPIIRLSNAISKDVGYSVPFESIKKLWNRFSTNLEKSNLNNMKYIMNVVFMQIYLLPIEERRKLCMYEFNRAYTLKAASKIDKEMLEALIQFCKILMGKDIVQPYIELLNAIASALYNYETHTGVRGLLTNLVEGENESMIELQAVYKAIYENANFTSDDLYHQLSVVNSIINRKKSNYPDRISPSLVDKSFNLLAEKMRQIESKLKVTQPFLYKSIVTQFFISNITNNTLLPYRCASNIADHFDNVDIGNIRSVRK